MLMRLFLFVTAITALFLPFGCSATNSLPTELTQVVAPPEPEVLTPPEVAPQVQSEEAEEPQGEGLFIADTERYQLVYPAAFCEEVPLETVILAVEIACDHIERLLGEFKQKISIGVVGQIVPEGTAFPDGLHIAGVTFEADGQICVIVALHSANIETFAHELAHARFRDLGLNPPRWLEEGLAHYCETPDGFNADLLAVLAEEGMMSPEDLESNVLADEREMQRRATAWAFVCLLIAEFEYSLVEIAALEALPEAVIAAAKAAAPETASK